MEFLPDATRRVYGVKPVHDITAKDKHVIIIGGGDTGCRLPRHLHPSRREGRDRAAGSHAEGAATSARTTSRGRRSRVSTRRPPRRRRAALTCTAPILYNFVAPDEEQARVHIEDSTASEGFVADENGHVTGLKVVDAAAPGENGPFTRQPGLPNACCPRYLVLISVGFLHPDTSTLLDQLPVELDKRGNVARNDKSSPPLRVHVVFVAGDAGRGQSLVVWAISEGRSCAAAVDEYLTGVTELPAPITASQRPAMLPR